MNEKCIDCKHCEIIEYGCNGFLGESLFSCQICEEKTEDKALCFEEKQAYLEKGKEIKNEIN